MNTREEYAEHVVNGWLRAGWIAPAPAPWHITPLLVAALTAQAEASAVKGSSEAASQVAIFTKEGPEIAEATYNAALGAAPQIPEDADEHS